MVQPVAFANEMVGRFSERGHIDHMKLQKLLYFANGWWLGMTGAPLLDSRPQVWRYGPVFSSVYSAFSPFGHSRIQTMAPAGPFGGDPARLPPEDLAAVASMMDWIWGRYGRRSGVELSDETHAPGTPWQQIAAANNYTIPFNIEIPSHEDWQYFAGLVQQEGWQVAPFNPNAQTGFHTNRG